MIRIVITGPQGCGKSKMAEDIMSMLIHQENNVWIQEEEDDDPDPMPENIDVFLTTRNV